MTFCEFPEQNATSEEIKEILTSSRNIAVFGITNNPEKASYSVAKYLKEHGYRIFPINPRHDEILGEKCYPDLKSVPEKIDIVDIFRKPSAIPPVVDDAIDIGAKVVWMQSGLAHNEAAEKARAHGLKVVMNKCIKIEHMGI